MAKNAQKDLSVSHPGEDLLLANLDGELSADERQFVSLHLEQCELCRERRDQMTFLSKRVEAALDEVLSPSPWEEMPPALREAADSHAPSIKRAPAARWGIMALGRRSLATAAAATLVMGGAAYGIPGSPVKGWVDGGVNAVAKMLNIGRTPAVPMVAVAPKDGTVKISFTQPKPDLHLRVSLVREAEATVTGDGHFLVEQGHILIDGPGGEVIIELPRAATEAAVLVGGVEVARFDGEELRATRGARSMPIEVTIDD